MESAKISKFVLTDTDRETFLKNDFADALKWLVVGAVMWQATELQENRPERCPHQRAVGMFTSLVQARALYDFYYSKKTHNGDDARSNDFVNGWTPMKKQLLNDYLGPGAPANKRIFHLVFLRGLHSGGTDNNEDTHLKNQVLLVARDLIEITREFVARVRPEFGQPAQDALREAVGEAKNRADDYKIANPFQAS